MTSTVIPLAQGETLDLKSFVLTAVNGDRYDFQGLKADVSSLPKVNAIGTGSTAYCVDTAELYMYEKSTRTWYEQ